MQHSDHCNRNWAGLEPRMVKEPDETPPAATPDDDPRYCGQKSDEMPSGEYVQLAAACDFLEHYQTCHAKDKISRFRGKGEMPDIILVSDREWKNKLAEFLKEAGPQESGTGEATTTARARSNPPDTGGTGPAQTGPALVKQP